MKYKIKIEICELEKKNYHLFVTLKIGDQTSRLLIDTGKFSLKKIDVAVLPIGHVNQTYKQINLPPIDGVLGSDFLMKFKAVINYRKAEIVINTNKN